MVARRFAGITVNACCWAPACMSLPRASRTTPGSAGAAKEPHLEVPGDFSSAAFFIVAGLLGRAKTVAACKMLVLIPRASDCWRSCASMGGRIEVEKRARRAERSPWAIFASPPSVSRAPSPCRERLQLRLAIDEFPALFVAAASRTGETVIAGAEELRVKESDRIAAMGAGFTALGVKHRSRRTACAFRARPGAGFAEGEVDSCGDHRIAMAFAVASLRASGPIAVRDTANVATSFPGFVELARSTGLALAESGSGDASVNGCRSSPSTALPAPARAP